jgi:carotenoid 1,2-hydratase
MDGLVPAIGLTHPDARSVSGWGEHASRSWCSDGGRFRPLSDGRDPGGLRFDTPVSRGGYAWWYIDALSADGRYGLTVIAFVGSVFSPYYAFSRKHGSGDPLNHCALNIAFYSENRKCWAMTERGSGQLHRTSNSLTIGPSNVDWNGDSLTIDIREVTAPVPSRLRGVIRIYPKALSTEAFTIDGSGRHRWRPFAPCAHVEVSMSEPTLRWHGSGYVDSNNGDEPLEDAFHSWTWSRAELRRGTVALYDVVRLGGQRAKLALLFNPSGQVEEFESPTQLDLPSTGWNIARQTRADDASRVRILKSLESGPFYARSLISTSLLNQQAFAIHESLSLDRFRSPWVQALLPFRMPRALR